MTVSLEGFSAALGELAVRMGLCANSAFIAEPVYRMTKQPFVLYSAHSTWPSTLGDNGVPVELSIKIDWSGEHHVRCVADPTDYRRSVGDNFAAYVAAAVDATHADPREVRQVLARLLADAPHHLAAPIMIGLDFGRAATNRSSVYVSTSWWSFDEFRQRLPEPATVLPTVAKEHGTRVPPQPEVYGLDFIRGQAVRWKTYQWLPVRLEGLNVVGGHHPDLSSARLVYDWYAANVPPPQRETSAFLQVTVDACQVREKVFFFAPAWGWSTPDGLRDLLSFLVGDLGADLSPLIAIRNVLAEHQIPVRLTMIAVGGTMPGASISFYFVPHLSRGSPQ